MYLQCVQGRFTLFVVVGALSLFGAGTAHATTYCVGLADTCDPANNRASLESALSAAAANAGADEVLLGDGTFTAAFSSGFDYTAADPVEIIGRGATATTITTGAINPGEAVLTLTGHADSAVRDLAVAIPAIAGAADGIVLSAGTASGVNVLGTSTTQVRRGIVLTGGLVADSSVLAPGSNSGSTAVVNTDGTTDNVHARGPVGINLTGTTTTTRLYAETNSNAGIWAGSAGTHSISQSVIRAATNYGIYLTGGGATTHVTILDTTIANGGTYGVYSSQTASSTLTMSGMNIVNNSYGIYRNGASSVSTTYSNVWNNTSSNYVSTVGGTGTISANPLFISATNLRLQASSPLIDLGNPTPPAASEDFGGRPRDVDGNGDATARRDIGAHEYQRAAPVVTATGTPTQPQPGEVVTFTAAASDPDGDPFVIGWTFSDGTVANTGTVEKTFTAPGTYTGTVIVTDASGRESSAQASVTVPAPPEETVDPPADPPPTGGGETPPPANPAPVNPIAPVTIAPPADTQPPAVSAFSLPKVVRSGKAAPAPAPNGTLRLTLSEAASLKLTFTRAQVLRGKTRFVRVPGSIALTGKAGANRFRFAGRLSRTKALKPGRYRVTLTATDAAGNVAKALTRTFVLRAA